jgi:agmatinase
VHLVSTGKKAQERLQRKLYGAETAADIAKKFHAELDRIPDARGVVLGIPSDVGAGFVRGANLGPQVIRAALLDMVPDWPARARAAGIVDIGDVFVVPQLLHDDMLSDAQQRASRAALYPSLSAADAARLPVSPLSIAERVFDLVFAVNGRAAPFVIGGDHSTAWPVVAALARARKDRWAIVQPDAHTDLLETRLGIQYCFATWSYHANELLGRDGRLVQVGIRASGRDRAHWESTPEAVYLSNDIDGTDDSYADATGTPEPWGLEPDWVVALIRRLGAEIGLLGGDIMEVAPPLRQIPRGAHRTTDLAARYLSETMRAALRVEL